MKLVRKNDYGLLQNLFIYLAWEQPVTQLQWCIVSSSISSIVEPMDEYNMSGGTSLLTVRIRTLGVVAPIKLLQQPVTQLQ
jgi:hypothetical protein